jgi:hypothetical protein
VRAARAERAFAITLLLQIEMQIDDVYTQCNGVVTAILQQIQSCNGVMAE